MWADILLSITMSVSEAIGCSYIEKKKKGKMLKELSKIISEHFEEFADSSLDCNDFYLLVKSKKFIEIMRNFFVSINDGMDRSHYIENVEQYIFDECTNINHNEVRTFLKKIEELYISHLHKIVEDYPGTYALFQLMTISHREVIGKILENERNIKKYFNALECKKIQIDDENIDLFHAVSEKEYGTIRFTGISGAERKREQNINEFYVENTFSYYGKEIEKLYNLLSKPKLSEEFLENKIREWTFTADDLEASSDEENREKPWDRMKNFAKSDVDGKMDITLSNGIYVDSTNLKPAMQNKIRRMAAFSNPVFYKNRAIGTSNYDTSRWIYLGKDHLGGYIQIPRGLQDELIANIDKAGIEYTIDDERQQGRNINVEFNGELRPEQNKALKELTKHDNGILHAATAFGKTVVCSAVIAEKKVNTLILLESSALIEQWKDALNKFLIIDEELPQYKTKTGRLRTRKSLIGTLQGVHDSMTGIVDIAMVGSLCKKGEFHNLLNDYGLVIIDECHHSASETIANVLKEVKARYVYGVTATPKRGDGLEKINYMLIGPIRYSYTAKEKAMEQGIQHLVYPRFTRTVPPRGVLIGKMHPNEAYEIIHNNDIRDEQIIEDIKNCVSAGRTPVVLSRYKDHSEKLYKRLKDYADHVFLMTGNNSKKEHKKILEQMHQVDKAESLILIATGSLVGEGFDFPRLDTLFMATPVSFRGVVEQYAGRLNRDYAGKENVIIYDYVDNHITMFNNMYMKRLKAYKQIGYEIAGGLHNDKQTANAIYDGDNYAENYHKDLLDANKNIIISSPAISGTKVYELINLLKEKQLSGVQITIVTWAPDSYGFGDAAYWMQLHEEMRKAGFYIKTVEESCERFAVIDQEVVWYGNINLLAKDKVDDSIMRVLSKEIASELMEITFGDNG